MTLVLAAPFALGCDPAGGDAGDNDGSAGSDETASGAGDGDDGGTTGGSATTGGAGDSGATGGGSDPTGSDDGVPSGPIHAVGDSVLAIHADEAQSIPDVAGRVAGYEVRNMAVGGAMVLEGGDERIPNQYQPGEWSWVIIEGGANDLGDGCGCGDCLAVVDRLISTDSTGGAMVEFLDRVRGDGNRIVLLGYYRIPPAAAEFVECDEEFAALNGRYQAYAAAHDGVVFVDMGWAMDGTDTTLYAEDRVHPSLEGSRAVGNLIGEAMAGG